MLLFVGIIAINAVALIGSIYHPIKRMTEDFVDLNEPDNSMGAEDDNNLQADESDASDRLDNTETSPDPDVIEGEHGVAENDRLLEFDVFTEEEENGIDIVEDDESAPTVVEQDIEEQPTAVETAELQLRTPHP